jgi:hypothetical protein
VVLEEVAMAEELLVEEALEEVASVEVVSAEDASVEEASVVAATEEMVSAEVALPIQLHKTTLVNNLLDITTWPHTLYHQLQQDQRCYTYVV